jgi:hypothetical protein
LRARGDTIAIACATTSRRSKSIATMLIFHEPSRLASSRSSISSSRWRPSARAGQVIAAAGRAGVGGGQVDHADHAGQRRAQLMRDLRQEAGLGGGVVARALAVADQLVAGQELVADVGDDAVEHQRRAVGGALAAHPRPQVAPRAVGAADPVGGAGLAGAVERGATGGEHPVDVVGVRERQVLGARGRRRQPAVAIVQLVHAVGPLHAAGGDLVGVAAELRQPLRGRQVAQAAVAGVDAGDRDVAAGPGDHAQPAVVVALPGGHQRAQLAGLGPPLPRGGQRRAGAAQQLEVGHHRVVGEQQFAEAAPDQRRRRRGQQELRRGARGLHDAGAIERERHDAGGVERGVERAGHTAPGPRPRTTCTP